MNFDEANQPVPGFPEMYKHSKFWREKCWHKEILAGKLMTILTKLKYNPECTIINVIFFPAKIVKEWIHNDVYDAFFITYLYHWAPLQFHPSLGSITNDG